MSSKNPSPGVGIGVDASGGAVVDPTQNVLLLVEAANARQDDLRAETNKRIDAEIQCIKEISELRAQHGREMAIADSNRLDAIRQVDVLAVSTAAERASQAIAALAATTSANAENLRAMVANTAATIAAQSQATVTAITDRLSMLERSSYEGKGKEAVADPMMAELIREVKGLRESRDAGAGRSAGVQASWGLLIGAVSLVAALTLIASRLMQ